METLIARVGIDELIGAPQFPALIEEYAQESAVDGMPPPQARIESYRALHWNGMLHIFAATRDDALIGFITIAAPPSPHFSVPIAIAESFFVAAAHRSHGAPGLRLLAAAEKQAQELGSPVFLVCAPFGGRLFELLPKCGYAETNRIYCKKFNNA